jgi:hypothetical protein
MYLVLIFTRSYVNPRAMERSEGDMSLKNPVTPPRIDPKTVRLVAQRLNHYATPGPELHLYLYLTDCILSVMIIRTIMFSVPMCSMCVCDRVHIAAVRQSVQ